MDQIPATDDIGKGVHCGPRRRRGVTITTMASVVLALTIGLLDISCVDASGVANRNIGGPNTPLITGKKKNDAAATAAAAAAQSNLPRRLHDAANDRDHDRDRDLATIEPAAEPTVGDVVDIDQIIIFPEEIGDTRAHNDMTDEPTSAEVTTEPTGGEPFEMILDEETQVAEGEAVTTSEPTTPYPTFEPTPAPVTPDPTPRPTSSPTYRPTARPTVPWWKNATPEPTREPTPRPTPQPTPRPTPSPTAEPTERPTEAPVANPTPYPTLAIDATLNSFPETAEPTGEPSLPTGITRDGSDLLPPAAATAEPIELDRWVRVNLKSVPGGNIMNNIQRVAFEDVAQEFLADLFQLTIPVVYDVGVEVTGQKVLVGGGRRVQERGGTRKLRGDNDKAGEEEEEVVVMEYDLLHEDEDKNIRHLQDFGEVTATPTSSPTSSPTSVQVYPLQVDLRVSGKFDPTDVHRTADDVNFDSMCRNFFTVNGGAVVTKLNALADQAMETQVGDEEDMVQVDGTGLEYFATIEEVRGVTPPTAADAEGGGDGNVVQSEGGGDGGGGGNSNQLAYLIAIIVGSVAFVGLVGTMFFIARRNKRRKRGYGGGGDDDDRNNSRSRSNGSSPSKKKSPSKSKRSKQSPAALSILSDEERVSKIPPGPIDSPEEAQSEVGSLARIHMLDAEDYSYSLEDGIGTSPRSLGPLFKKRSNDEGKEVPTSYNDNLYGPGKNGDDDEESDFGDAADDATFSEFGKVLSSPANDSLPSKFKVGSVFDKAGGSGHGYDKDMYGNSTPTNGANELRQKQSLVDDLSPSTAGFSNSPPAVQEQPAEKPKKKKTYGASARKKKSSGSSVDKSGDWSVGGSSAASSRASSKKDKKTKKSTLGDLSIDGSAAAAEGTQDPLSPDADAWLYETITDVLGPNSVAGSVDDQSARSGKSANSGTNDAPKKLSSFGKKSKSSRSSRSKKSSTPQAVPEDDIADEAPIPEPMVYTGGGDDQTVMTTVTKLEDAGMVRRDCYAPPGKLGVVIDSTSKGPVVHEVKGGSPLEGIVFPGDRIIAIDGEDTRTLPASMVTKIMAAKKDQQRRMTVLSVVTGID